jgi:hypothetical protein
MGKRGTKKLTVEAIMALAPDPELVNRNDAFLFGASEAELARMHFGLAMKGIDLIQIMDETDMGDLEPVFGYPLAKDRLDPNDILDLGESHDW